MASLRHCCGVPRLPLEWHGLCAVTTTMRLEIALDGGAALGQPERRDVPYLAGQRQRAHAMTGPTPARRHASTALLALRRGGGRVSYLERGLMTLLFILFLDPSCAGGSWFHASMQPGNFSGGAVYGRAKTLGPGAIKYLILPDVAMYCPDVADGWRY